MSPSHHLRPKYLTLCPLVLGAMDTALSCNIHSTLVPKPAGFMYERIPAGLAASVLSLSTNLLATILVGYKAWCVCGVPTCLFNRSVVMQGVANVFARIHCGRSPNHPGDKTVHPSHRVRSNIFYLLGTFLCNHPFDSTPLSE